MPLVYCEYLEAQNWCLIQSSFPTSVESNQTHFGFGCCWLTVFINCKDKGEVTGFVLFCNVLNWKPLLWSCHFVYLYYFVFNSRCLVVQNTQVGVSYPDHLPCSLVVDRPCRMTWDHLVEYRVCWVLLHQCHLGWCRLEVSECKGSCLILHINSQLTVSQKRQWLWIHLYLLLHIVKVSLWNVVFFFCTLRWHWENVDVYTGYRQLWKKESDGLG